MRDLGISTLALTAAATGDLVAIKDAAAPAQPVQPKGREVAKIALDEALKGAQTQAPSVALKKLNEDRHGRSRYVYMPVPLGRHDKANARRKAQMEKAAVKMRESQLAAMMRT